MHEDLAISWYEAPQGTPEGHIFDGTSFTPPPEPPASESIVAEIAALEASITPRRVREAILGADDGWLAGVDAQIEALRSQLAD